MAKEKLFKGGEFLITDALPEEVFTPEDYSKDQRLVAQSAEEFAIKELQSKSEQLREVNYQLVKEMLLKAGELGFLGADMPEVFGGSELDKVSSMLIGEKLCYGVSGFMAAYGVQTGIGSLPIVLFGSPEQKKKYLPRIASAEIVAAYALTEPGHGSDALGAETRAALSDDGKHYILNGTKRFISAADLEGPIVIFAKDDETNFPTGFMVEKFCPGYSVSEPWHKIGMRGGTMTDVYLKDVRVPAANMLGPKGQGYWVLQAGIAFGKIGVSSGALGGMQAALDLCIKYAKEKQHRDKTIAKFQGVQMDIAKIAEKTEAARWLCYRLGCLAETSKDLRLFAKEAALTKSFVTEAAVDVSRLAIAIHGSYGVMQDYAVERIYRDMIIGEQVEGVADLQRVITASILLG